jgi:hypothetical protein
MARLRAAAMTSICFMYRPHDPTQISDLAREVSSLQAWIIHKLLKAVGPDRG